MSRGLELWTIYEHPSDFPHDFVLRRSVVLNLPPRVVHDAEPTALTDTLEEARSYLPRGLFCLGREPADDPVIVEVWI